MARTVLGRRAWRIRCPKLGQDGGIVAAASRSRAKCIARNSALDAGYILGFVDFEAVRAPEFDLWAETFERRACMSEECVRDMLVIIHKAAEIDAAKKEAE